MRDVILELQRRKEDGQLTADEQLFDTDIEPLTVAELKAAEDALGFELTPTLRRLFTEVANGGFGPQYGLLGLQGGMRNEDGDDAIDLYKFYREPDPEDVHWAWPEALLPLGCLGCAMYLCVDCTQSEGPITWFEPNPHETGQTWTESFIEFASSTDIWLLAWLDGEDLFTRLVNKE